MSGGVIAHIGLGSNLEDSRQHIQSALTQLGRIHATRLAARSSLYRSIAIGPPDQPDYVNAAATLCTELAPHELLDELQAIERLHGRKRTLRWGPRTLDLDLLLFGDQQIHSARLTVPHPQMHLRAFVLIPLLEIAPQIEIPGHGAAADLLTAIDATDVVPLVSAGGG